MKVYDYDIFISYSTKDAEKAFDLCGILEDLQFKCWIAPRNIMPGSPYAREIVDGIKKSALIVVVFSENSLQSAHVLNEIDIAVKSEKIVLPYIVTGLMINDLAYSQLTSSAKLIERISSHHPLFVNKQKVFIKTDFDAIAYLNYVEYCNVKRGEISTLLAAGENDVVTLKSEDELYAVDYIISTSESTQTIDVRLEDFVNQSMLADEQARLSVLEKYRDVDIDKDFEFDKGYAFVDNWDLSDYKRTMLLNRRLEVVATFENYYMNFKYSEGFVRVAIDGHAACLNDSDWHLDARFVYGFLTILGEPFIPFKYRKAKPFVCGIAAVSEDGGKWGAYNKTGKMITPLVYDDCYGVVKNRAVVKYGGKFGVIDDNGNEIIPCKFQQIDSRVDDEGGCFFQTEYLNIDINGKVISSLPNERGFISIEVAQDAIDKAKKYFAQFKNGVMSYETYFKLVN